MLGGDGFGKSGEGVGFIKKGLALKIGRLDKIAIDDAYFPDAGARQKIRGGGTDGAATDDDGAGGEEALLSLLANAREENLAGVFFVQRIVHLAAGLCESGIAFLPTKTRKPEGASSVPYL